MPPIRRKRQHERSGLARRGLSGAAPDGPLPPPAKRITTRHPMRPYNHPEKESDHAK